MFINSLASQVGGDFETLFASSLDSVVGMSDDGKIIAWNRSAEECFGWTQAEALGRQLAETIIPPRFRHAHDNGLLKYKTTGSGPVINSRVEVVALRRGGIEFPAELTVIPVKNLESGVFFAFIRDISDRKKLVAMAEQRTIEAQILYEAVTHISDVTTTEEIYSRCLQKICELAGWSVGHVYVPEPGDNPAKLVSTDIWHLTGPELAGIQEATGTFSFMKGEGLPGRIWSSQQVEWIEDPMADVNFPRKEVYITYGFKAAFGFPVMVDGRLIAVLEFFTSSAHKPDQVLMLAAGTLTHQLGAVLGRQKAFEHRETLLKEMDHRLGNLFAVLSSVLHRTSKYADNKEDLADKFDGRMRSLLKGYQLLTRGRGESAALSELIEATVGPHRVDAAECLVLVGEEVWLHTQRATTFSMIFHELATNAAKYGALSVSDGVINVHWRAISCGDEKRLEINWVETGGPPPRETGRTGFGTVLIKKLITGLGGTSFQELAPGGFKLKLIVPWDD